MSTRQILRASISISGRFVLSFLLLALFSPEISALQPLPGQHPTASVSAFAKGRIIVKYKSASAKAAADYFESGRSFQRSGGLSALDALHSKHKVLRLRSGRLFSGLDKSLKAGKSEARISDEIERKFPKRTLRAPRIAKKPQLSNIYVLELDRGADAEAAVQEFSRDPDVEYAELDKYVKIMMTSGNYILDPTDNNSGGAKRRNSLSSPSPVFISDSIGQAGGVETLSIAGLTSCAGFIPKVALSCSLGNPPINDPYYRTRGTWGQSYDDLWGIKKVQGILPTWKIASGEGVTVAVVDTGIDYHHPDIQENMWVKVGEVPGNGMDDDGNGYVDDVYGYNFVSNHGNPMDGHGHGTHIAGTIAAVGSNGIGVIGVAFKSKVMALKGLDDNGRGFESDLAEALQYAADNGADVINNSWGGSGESSLIRDAVNYAYSLGVVVVASAGNSSLDAAAFIPAGYPNIITVAASDPDDKKAEFSNFGAIVDVTAPGVDVLSLRASGTDMYGDGTHIVGSDYYRADGTSMASPHVAGLAALLISKFPALTNEQIRDSIVYNTDDIDANNPGFSGKLGTGRINAQKALANPLIALTHQISGTVRNPESAPIPGIEILLSDAGSKGCTTGSDGSFLFPSLIPHNYTIAPISRLKDGYVVIPDSRKYEPLVADQLDQDFTVKKIWDVEDLQFLVSGAVEKDIAVDVLNNPHLVLGNGRLSNSITHLKKNGATWERESFGDFGFPSGGSSIATDPMGMPHIVYQDVVRFLPCTINVKYARWTGSSWDIETVDSDDICGGPDVDIAVDSAGRPHIAYLSGSGIFPNGSSSLKYAKKVGSTWEIQTIDTDNDAVGTRPSIALDSTGNPHFAYKKFYPRDELPFAKWNVRYAAWKGTGWDVQDVNSPVDTLVDPQSANVTIAMAPNNSPHIVYGQSVKLNSTISALVQYAERNSGNWRIQTVDSESSAGVLTSLAIDPGGNPLIFYIFSDIAHTKLATKIGGAWDIEFAVPAILSPVGISVGPDGIPQVYYRNIGNHLSYAKRVGSSVAAKTQNSGPIHKVH